jgi:NAD(P)-dependent dehydrogenase (short-subunit alcohol dehydrogenase family)
MSDRQKGLIIGAGSGVGRAFHNSMLRVRSDIEWFAPPMQTLDIRNEFLIMQYINNFGPFDYIVYTAGVNRLAWVEDLSSEELVDVYKVNVFGLPLIVGAQKKMFQDSKASVVAVVSDSYRTPMRGSLPYGSSKAALYAVIRNLARELAPDWRVNGVSPGIIEGTPMSDYIDATVPGFRGWDPEKAKAYEKTLVPMGRRATTSEISSMIEFALFGPEFMTGSILEITGGK